MRHYANTYPDHQTLHPPVRPELVSRPRLIERLNVGATRKLTLISAPAGFGKTTLLSEWVHCRGAVTAPVPAPVPAPLQVAWLSLDEGDNDTVRFLAYVVAALQTIGGDVGQGVLAALQSPGAVNVESVLTTLLNEIATLSDNFILVLDDYHVIESPAIDKALTFLLDHLPPQMHMGLATRTDPTLPLSRLRARGQLTELRADDLRFTSDEAAAFLQQAIRLPISAEDVRALEKRTEGWITGLQLAAVAMQGFGKREQIAHFIHSFGGSHRYIIDYLIDEVLDQQTPQVQEFLLRTSILNRMTASLCDVVASRKGSQAILERLDAANLFLIPLDGERRWYRYHHLFAELLRHRLHQQQPDNVSELHIRASAWYEESDLEIEALHHAAVANDFERAARLVEGDGTPLYLRGEMTPVLNWLESLPKSQLDARPILWVIYAGVLQAVGRFASLEKVFQDAEAALQKDEPDANARNLLGGLAVLRATLLFGQHEVESGIAMARRALDLARPTNFVAHAAASWALGRGYLMRGDRAAAGQAFAEALEINQAAGSTMLSLLATTGLGHIEAGENRLHQAAQTYRRALQLAGEHPQSVASDTCYGLARVCYEWNDLDAAQRHGQQGVQLAQQKEMSDQPIAGQALLARVKLAQGDVDGAVAILDQARQSIRQHQFTFRIPEVAAVQVLALLRQGDLAAAADLAREHDLPISQARVHLARGDTSAALAILDSLVERMEAKGWKDKVLKIMVLRAVALHAHSETGQAVQVLGEALALAEAGGFVRTFVDKGAPMAQLLRETAKREIMPDYTGKLLAVFQSEKQGNITLPPQPLIEPLSPRELQVLELVAQGLSNREISERLFLALDTVKGHNHRIYGKLGVKNRTQAVNKAVSLKIIAAQ